MMKKVYSLLTLVSSLGGLVIGLIFYIPFDSTYRPWSNYISDLGTGPLGAVIALGLMLGLIAVFVTLLMIEISKDIKKPGLQNLFLFVSIFAQISLLALAIFPLNPSVPRNYETHRICALFYFGFSAITDFFLFGFEFKTEKLSAILILLSGIFALFFGIGFYLQEFGPIPKNMIVYLIEWGYFALTMAWLTLKLLPLKKK